MRPILQFFMLGMLVALWGCGKEDSAAEAPPKAGAGAPVAGAKAGAQAGAPAAKPVDSEAKATAKNIYTQRCAICHGQNGKGDGAGAASLNPKPRNYSDKAWQSTVTDDHLSKVIVEGGVSAGLSAIMPPNPDLGQKPEVLAAMVQMIRGFAQ